MVEVRTQAWHLKARHFAVYQRYLECLAKKSGSQCNSLSLSLASLRRGVEDEFVGTDTLRSLVAALFRLI